MGRGLLALDIPTMIRSDMSALLAELFSLAQPPPTSPRDWGSKVSELTAPTLHAQALARIEEEITRAKEEVRYQNSIIGIGVQEARRHFQSQLSAWQTLKAVLEKCFVNGYMTWDRDKVPLVNGKYEEEATKKWEAEHGHDIRLKCYPEFGCQLLLDPQELVDLIIKGVLR